MGDFLAILAACTPCDATAPTRPMGRGEVAACAGTCDALNAWFVPGVDLAPDGTRARFARMSEAYRAFQPWEAESPDPVARLRSEARAAARGLAGPAL